MKFKFSNAKEEIILDLSPECVSQAVNISKAKEKFYSYLDRDGNYFVNTKLFVIHPKQTKRLSCRCGINSLKPNSFYNVFVLDAKGVIQNLMEKNEND